MARIERSKGRKTDFKGSSPKRTSNRNFEDSYRSDGTRHSGRKFNNRRDSGGGSNRYSRNRSDVEMTKVICSSCGVECEVPFKPTSNKPVYCSDCFEKKEKGGSNRSSSKDLDIINEKLNKIMKALKIE